MNHQLHHQPLQWRKSTALHLSLTSPHGSVAIPQHKNSLDPKFKLPRMKYKGEQVCSMRIRVDKKALVQEVIDVRSRAVLLGLVPSSCEQEAAGPFCRERSCIKPHRQTCLCSG